MLKKIFLSLMFVLATSTFAIASQAPAHFILLGFTKSTSDVGAPGSGYNTYRFQGACPAVVDPTQFTKLNPTPFTGVTYEDDTVIPGTYCYFLTFTDGTQESVPSMTVQGTVLPAAPTITLGDVN